MRKHKNSQFKWILRQAKGFRPLMILLMLISVALAVGIFVLALMIRNITEIATGDLYAPLSHSIFTAIGAVLFSGTVFVAGRILTRVLRVKVEGRLRTNLLEAIFTRNFADIQKIHTGKMMVRLSDDIEQISLYLPYLISGIGRNITMMAGATLGLFYLSWQMALIIIVVLPVSVFFLNLFGPHIRKRSMVNKDDEERHRTHMQESVSKLQLFKVYGMMRKVILRNHDLYSKKYKSSIRLAFLEGMSEYTNTLLSYGMFLLILGTGSLFVSRGVLTVGALVATTTLTSYITNPFTTLSEYISDLAKSSASAERLRELINLPSEQDLISSSHITPISLKLSDITFSYDDMDVLKGVSLQANLNEIVGIVGESGSGKSTLIKIIMGLYCPKDGDVELAGKCGGSTKNILPHVSYVPSDSFIFSASVEENICMSRDVDENLLVASAKKAGIHDFIMSLPNKYQEAIGESSHLLSSGQSQRIGIARALYKNSHLMIFDEPTSNLDYDAILTILETIKSISKEKICLIATHDISIKNICDKIYTIKDGVIEDCGQIK
ncbi:MAG: ABC transporter ATP-binding protein/permease [Defluviitaleaceae bacterium]|nr:ABC transporter ATP-binding protein/permease [Defluviitaleaceae bacterium]